MPFTDELMICVVCSLEEKSNPNIQSRWRALEIDNQIIYACPNEFPSDRARKEAFQKAYQLVIACGLDELIARTGKARNPEIELYRKQRQQARNREKPRGFSDS
jgi:hypothetical protein